MINFIRKKKVMNHEYNWFILLSILRQHTSILPFHGMITWHKTHVHNSPRNVPLFSSLPSVRGTNYKHGSRVNNIIIKFRWVLTKSDVYMTFKYLLDSRKIQLTIVRLCYCSPNLLLFEGILTNPKSSIC